MRNEKSQDSADATLLILNLMSVDSDRFKLSKEEKEKVEKAISSVKYQNKALVQIYRERLGKKWEEYPAPEWDMLKVRGSRKMRYSPSMITSSPNTNESLSASKSSVFLLSVSDMFTVHTMIWI